VVKLYRCFVAGLLLFIFVTLAWKPLDATSPFWPHAVVGREVAEHGIPRQTLFLWTARIPWVYHSWLSQLAFYGMTRLPAFPYWVAGLTVALAIIPFAGALWIWARRARDSWWVAVPAVLVLQGIAVRFETRPELFSNVLLFLLLVFLALGRESDLRRPWWPIVVLAGFSLWANLHGAVVLGLILLAATAVCDLVQERASPKSRLLALLAALAPLAICVNPYGLDYWQALRPVNSFTLRSYLEWSPIYKTPWLPWESQVAAVLAGGGAVLAWALSPRRRAAELVWVLLCGGLFVIQRRNIWPFCTVCLTVAALNAAAIDTQSWWDRLTHGRPNHGVPPGRWAARAAIVTCLVIMAYFSFQASYLGAPLTPVDFDTGVVSFLREHRDDLHGHVLNDQEVSGYLEWSLPDGPPLYIDRLDAFPDKVMRQYLAICTTRKESNALITEVDVVIFAVNRRGPPLLAAAHNLDRSRNWARVYVGRDAVVWVRRSKHADLVAACQDISQVDFATLLGGRPGESERRGTPDPGSARNPGAVPITAPSREPGADY
jgi:hypothetical protein